MEKNKLIYYTLLKLKQIIKTIEKIFSSFLNRFLYNIKKRNIFFTYLVNFLFINYIKVIIIIK